MVARIEDSACGYAAYTLMPADSRVLSVEFKTNLPFRADARVFRTEMIFSETRPPARGLQRPIRYIM